MMIECPQCRESISPIASSIPPEGLNVICRSCGMSFLMRPHMADTEPEEQEALPATPAASGQPLEEGIPLGRLAPLESGDLPQDIFLQKDEIPPWIVNAYEQQEEEQPPPPASDFPDEDFLSRDLTGEEPMPEEDLSVLIDDTEMGIGDLADSELMMASPGIQDAAGLKRKSRSSKAVTRRAGILIIIIAILAAAFLFRKSIFRSTAKVLETIGKTVTSILPSPKDDRGKIQFSDLDSYFVPRGKKGGSVFVIQGKVTNGSDKQCHSIRVRGILFDERGQKAAEELAYCGNILTKDQIREDSQKVINEVLQNAYGAELSNFNVEPGGSVPFMLVFFKHPEKLSEFSIEIADHAIHKEGGE